MSGNSQAKEKVPVRRRNSYRKVRAGRYQTLQAPFGVTEYRGKIKL